MVLAELISLACYILTLVIFKDRFDPAFLESWDFVWRVSIITLISCLPLYILKFIQIQFNPPIHKKLMQYATLK
jgi:phospholipid-translocating ATPase